MRVTASLLLWAVFTPFVGAVVAPLLGRTFKAAAGYLLVFSFAPALALLSGVEGARAGDPVSATLPWVPAINLSVALHADGFSLLFALLVAGTVLKPSYRLQRRA